MLSRLYSDALESIEMRPFWAAASVIECQLETPERFVQNGPHWCKKTSKARLWVVARWVFAVSVFQD